MSVKLRTTIYIWFHNKRTVLDRTTKKILNILISNNDCEMWAGSQWIMDDFCLSEEWGWGPVFNQSFLAFNVSSFIFWCQTRAGADQEMLINTFSTGTGTIDKVVTNLNWSVTSICHGEGLLLPRYPHMLVKLM